MTHRSRSLTPALLLLTMLTALLGSCADGENEAPSADLAPPPPEWIVSIYPTPGADAAVPDAVEVRHQPLPPDQRIRLVIDGIDVTADADFTEGLVRYESGEGPVVLGGTTHQVEVLLVEHPPNDQTDWSGVDSYQWSFRTA